MVRKDIVKNEKVVMESFDFINDAKQTINYLMQIGEENIARRLRSAYRKNFENRMKFYQE